MLVRDDHWFDALFTRVTALFSGATGGREHESELNVTVPARDIDLIAALLPVQSSQRRRKVRRVIRRRPTPAHPWPPISSNNALTSHRLRRTN